MAGGGGRCLGKEAGREGEFTFHYRHFEFCGMGIYCLFS